MAYLDLAVKIAKETTLDIFSKAAQTHSYSELLNIVTLKLTTHQMKVLKGALGDPPKLPKRKDKQRPPCVNVLFIAD